SRHLTTLRLHNGFHLTQYFSFLIYHVPLKKRVNSNGTHLIIASTDIHHGWSIGLSRYHSATYLICFCVAAVRFPHTLLIIRRSSRLLIALNRVVCKRTGLIDIVVPLGG